MTFTQISDNYIRSAFSSPHYKLLEKIGEGGFGKVYTAHQINTGQIVAIKFLALDPNGEETQRTRYVERFKRETLLCSKLHHPNIVRLLDQGQCNDNLLFGVFEYVDGQSLRTFLTSNGPMSPLEAQDIMLQLLDALIHAHQQGIIHRDIKPANVMLSKGGARTHAKILDFGIGTLTQDSRHQEFHTLTLTQETLGTPSYSAPEQLRGEPATESTDLYVWGLLFLECLTGIPAVSGSSLASIYHKQLSDAQVPIPQALLGHPVAGLLRRLLHKNPNDRVITGEEAYQELTRMNMANLVGALGTFRAANLPNESTVILRDDEPNHPLHADYTFFTERKQITVLAVRFSIALIPGSDSDLDVLDALFKSHRGHCLDIATRFGAYHVGSLGDTSLFYFGYPTASDNDTRLCARTALEVMSDLAKRNALMKDSQGAILSMHAGIHSGIFTTYANSTPEGHIANAALALARHANSNQILCSREARSLLEPYTEFEEHDDLQLGLTSATEPVFKMVGERRIEAFGFMRGTRHNHELIGRDVELEQTLSMFNGLNQSNHIAHIFGEAGIGKSRLLQEIRKNASGYQHLVAQCLPEHQNNALYPILNLVRYLYNTPQLSSEKAIALFSDILVENTPSLDIENALPILMIWLNIEFGEELTASTLAPDRQKSTLFSSLTALLSSKYHSISEKKLYIVEDIHWADTTTLEFVQHFAKTLKQGDVLLSTSRQALPSQLKDLTLLEVGLKKLTEQATEDFIVKLFDKRPVARNVLDVLINRTDGIPLFIEELVDMIKQKELISVIEGEINFASPDKLEQVPSSLRQSLQQKLDSLVYAKETAQLAATIGREFEYDLLVAASSLSENQIQNDLKELIAKDLIVHQRHVNNDSYIFKHALVRDAAYESMTKEEASNKHQVCLSALIQTGAFESQPFISIYHLNKLGRYFDSIELLKKLADKALSSYSVLEAESLIKECIIIYEEFSLNNKELFFNLKNSLASHRVAGRGWIDDEASQAILENYNLVDENTDPKAKFITLRGLWLQNYGTGNKIEAHNIAVALFNDKNNYPNDFLPIIYEMLVQTLFARAEYKDLIQLLDNVPKEIYDNSVEAIASNFGFCSELICIGFNALSELYLGNNEAAHKLLKEQTNLALEIGVDELIAATYGLQAQFYLNCAFISESREDFDKFKNKAFELASESAQIATMVKNEAWLGYANMLSFLSTVDSNITQAEFEAGIQQFSAYLCHYAFYYALIVKQQALETGSFDADFFGIAQDNANETLTLYVKPQLNLLRKNNGK